MNEIYLATHQDYNIKRIAWVAAGIHVACSCLPMEPSRTKYILI